MKDLLFNARTILTRSRYPWIDYARGICIILVCYRHVFEGLTNMGAISSDYHVLKYLNIFFFSFRMPLFFIVSGIFVGVSIAKKGAHHYINSRVQTIFYPLLVWGCIQITLQLLFSHYINVTRVPIDYVRLVYMPRSVEQFWYLNALFFVSVLYVSIKVFLGLKPWQNLVLGIIFYGIAAYFHMTETNIGFLIDVLFFYLFFAIGDNISSWMLNPNNYRWFTSVKVFLFILPFFVVIQHYFTLVNLKHNNDYYVQNFQPSLYAIAALIGGALIISLSYLLQKWNILRFLRVIGYHSLYIYVMHLIITSATRTVLVRLLHVTNVPLLMVVSIVAGILIPIMVYNIAQRAGIWWLFSLKKEPLQRERVPRVLYQAGAAFLAPKQDISKTEPETIK